MGFFDGLSKGFQQLANGLAGGGVDPELLANGVLARGDVLGLTLSGTTVQVMNGLVERTCTLTLRVMRDGAQPYQVEVKQRIPEVYIPQLQQPGAALAVRVDPADAQRVAIDFDSQPPQVQLPESTGQGSAKHILETGTPIVVVFVASGPLGIRNHEGHDVHALTLTVAEGVPEPYQVQVGNAVPPAALPLMYPGARLHAKLGDTRESVVVDWAAGPAT